MRKKDILTGMVVEFNNMQRGLVLHSEIFLLNIEKSDFSGSTSLHFYNDNLVVESGFSHITKVFLTRTPTDTNMGTNLPRYMYMDDRYLTLIWEKQVVAEEMTLTEICEALGKEIKIVKETK